MGNAWKNLDLGGGGLQTTNLRLAALFEADSFDPFRENCRSGQAQRTRRAAVSQKSVVGATNGVLS